MVILAIVSIAFFFFVALNYKNEANRLSEIVRVQRRRISDLSYKIDLMRFNELYKDIPQPQRPVEIPKGTIDAVRLAMKVSHPDNGGKQEDFIKYREVYMKLTGK